MIAGANGLAIDGEQARLRRRRVVRRPARHAAPALPGRLAARATCASSCGPRSATEEFLERLAELDRDGQITARGWLRPAAAARMVARLRRRRAARRARPRPSSARSRGAVLKLVSVGDRPRRVRLRRRVGRPRAAAAGLRRARRRPHVSRVVEAGLHRGRGRRPAADRRRLAPALQGQAAVPPAHDLADHGVRAAAPRRRRRRGRPARPRRLDADRQGEAASRTSASTGRCSPTASCCARSRRCCARSSARTTTGRSPARWRAWSPTRSARRPCATTPGRVSRPAPR